MHIKKRCIIFAKQYTRICFGMITPYLADVTLKHLNRTNMADKVEKANYQDFINWSKVSEYFGRNRRLITFYNHPKKYDFLVKYITKQMEATMESSKVLFDENQDRLRKKHEYKKGEITHPNQ